MTNTKSARWASVLLIAASCAWSVPRAHPTVAPAERHDRPATALDAVAIDGLPTAVAPELRTTRSSLAADPTVPGVSSSCLSRGEPLSPRGLYDALPVHARDACACRAHLCVRLI